MVTGSKKNYVITIARGFGSGGKEIATNLAEEIGIPCYEKQILIMASEQSGINEQLFAKVDEKLRGKHIANMIKKVPYTNIVEPTNKSFTSDVNLYNIQAEIIRELANTESCIIIGKCANKILESYANVVSIYIEAPRKDCVNSIVNKLQVTEEEAKKMIYHTDKYRSDYYKYYTGGEDWTNPSSYDLTLNSARIGRDNCVKVIKEYLKIKLGVEV